MAAREVMETARIFARPVCKGDRSLGTACGTCERCLEKNRSQLEQVATGALDCQLVPNFLVRKPEVNCFHFVSGDQTVSFHPDGRVVYNGTPDEAAVAFWKAVETLWPADWKKTA
ncbi:MAG: hypothetical protein P4M05_28235 [Bradyrhizobium sp.]|nr:hypothetical protein [Bradyrhizobium sp.]